MQLVTHVMFIWDRGPSGSGRQHYQCTASLFCVPCGYHHLDTTMWSCDGLIKQLKVNYATYMHWHTYNRRTRAEPACAKTEIMLVFSALVVGLITAPVVPSLAQEKDKPVPPSGTKCPPVPGRNATCVCRTDKGIIDLTPISNSDGTPK